MPETLVERQVRLVLEQQCADLFMSLLGTIAVTGLHFTLLAFDFGEAGQFHNVAFKTSLHRPALIATFELLLRSWKGENVRRPTVARVDPAFLRQLVERARAALPAGVGCAMVLGSHDQSAYVSTADREGMQGTIGELLEHWKGEG